MMASVDADATTTCATSKKPGTRPGFSGIAADERARITSLAPRCSSADLRRSGRSTELDQRHRRGVALTEAELQDAQVAARARLVARTELVEELGHDVAVAQAVERQAAIRHRRHLRQRDHRLGDAAQLLRLRQRGPDRLVREQRVGHVAQHREAMAAGAVEFPQSVTVTHVRSFCAQLFTALDSWSYG